MWGAGAKPSPAPRATINNPGGVKAPSGRSAAGSMVKRYLNKASGRMETAQRIRNYKRPASTSTRSTASSGAPNKPPPKAYDPLETPYPTQAAFNQAVNRTAKAGYEPELNTEKSEEAGQLNLHNAREGSNVDIYNKASSAAQSALDTAKAAMGEIASRSSAATQQGQASLQAALSNTGVAGLQGVTDPNAAAYAAQGQSFGDQTTAGLAAEQSALIAERAGDTGVPLAGLNEARREEGQRYTGEQAKIGEARARTEANIPNLRAQALKQLSEQEVNRAGTKLQNQLGLKQLGQKENEGKRSNATNRAQIRASIQTNRENNAQKAKEYETATGLENKKLAIELGKFEKEEREAKGNKAKEAAKLAGERFANGVSAMAGYLKKDPKTEVDYASLTPQQRKEYDSGVLAPVGLEPGKTVYRKNAQQLYNELTQQQNLTAPEAFRLMKSSGNGYIEQFANEHEKIYNAAIQRRNNPAARKLDEIRAHPMAPLHQAPKARGGR